MTESALRKKVVQIAGVRAKTWPLRRLEQYMRAGGRMKKNTGVGAYCRVLVARVVGQTPDANPIGLGYGEMVKMVHKKFPDSLADERHLRWYAAQLRQDGADVPAHRRRTRWQ